MGSRNSDKARVAQLRKQVPPDPLTARLRRLEHENGLVLSWGDLSGELEVVIRATDSYRPLIMLGGTTDGSTLTLTLVHEGEKHRWYVSDLDFGRELLAGIAAALDPATDGPGA